MARPLNIAFLAAEALPFVKAGGLGDVAGALPVELARRGHQVDLILPCYPAVVANGYAGTPVLDGRVPFHGPGEAADFTLRALPMAEGLQALFIDAPAYFDREGLYTDPVTGEAYTDDGERFLFFALAALESLADRQPALDLLHCNDYHCGMIPLLLERNYRHRPGLARCASVFSIHNLAYQGIFDQSLLEKAGVHASEAGVGTPFEYWGRLNFMKAGICGAELISTVSPSYARAITRDPEQGHGLEGLLASRESALIGILNGIDTEAWNPAADPLIECPFDAEDPDTGKEVNKIALLAEAGLDYDRARPLFGIVSRLVSQKGFDLFEAIMPSLMELSLQLVVLGSGEKLIESLFRDFAQRYPDRLALFLRFDNRLAHRIEAGADFFLMPSRYEPCGLNQLYSLRYGTLPIVHRTGGLADTVLDLKRYPETGNGFCFEIHSPEALGGAIHEALATYADRELMSELRRRVMALDFSWARAADGYERLYWAAIAKRLGAPEEAAALLRMAGSTSAGK